ncbi:hypothetical protein ACI79G_16035 [Geodermatophilus sp. SYSU D00779]
MVEAEDSDALVDLLPRGSVPDCTDQHEKPPDCRPRTWCHGRVPEYRNDAAARGYLRQDQISTIRWASLGRWHRAHPRRPPGAGQPAPTLPRLYATVRDLVRHSDYCDRSKGEIEAALVNRLELLTDGSLGGALMGDGSAAFDWATLLSGPTIALAPSLPGRGK